MSKCSSCKHREKCSEIEQELSCEQVLALLDTLTDEELQEEMKDEKEK